MGLNLNLNLMLGVPETTECPRCLKRFDNRYRDYDIECGQPNTKPGKWSLRNYCPFCEHKFIEYFQIKTQ